MASEYSEPSVTVISKVIKLIIKSLCVCPENSRVKLKELLASLGGLVLSDADVVSVVSLLRDKSPNALDSWYKVRQESVFIWIVCGNAVEMTYISFLMFVLLLFYHQSATKFEPSSQQLAEKERLVTTLQEEASIAKDKVKQLGQVLQTKTYCQQLYCLQRFIYLLELNLECL